MTIMKHPEIERSFAIAATYFPDQKLALLRLLRSDSNFREMCVDLMEAKSELLRITASNDPKLESARVEWLELVDRLVAEISAFLTADEAALRKERK